MLFRQTEGRETAADIFRAHLMAIDTAALNDPRLMAGVWLLRSDLELGG